LVPIHYLCYAQPRVTRIASALAQAGIAVQVLPFQRVATSVVQATTARQALRDLANFDAVVLTSPNAVEALAVFVPELQPVQAAVSLPKIYAVGPGTAAALAAFFPDWPVKLPQDGYDADAVEQALLADRKEANHVAVIRGLVGRDDWIQRLQSAGFQTQLFVVYEAIDCQPEPAMGSLFKASVVASDPISVVLSSVRNVAQWIQWAQQLGLANEQLVNIKLFAIHPKILRELHGRGFTHTQLISPGSEALREALKSWS
jgi:uroporphyrinogen-III synthase